MKTILVIDDDPIIRKVLSQILIEHDFHVLEAADAESGLEKLEQKLPDLILTDYKMPGKSGLDVVFEINSRYPGLPVILMTAYDEIPLTIKAIQFGAVDYIDKSTPVDRYIEIINKCLKTTEQADDISKNELYYTGEHSHEEFPVGKTPLMMEIFKQIGKISMNRLSVLITGEPGTEKDQMANLIHQSGDTKNYPFMIINSKLISEKKLEEELFGYEKDFSAGLSGIKAGKLALVKNGTIVLDELSNMPLTTQSKIFEVLKSKKIQIIGSDTEISFCGRLIATTGEDTDKLINSGKLLADLYYQIKVFSINIPPLRMRKDDIPDILSSFIQQINQSFNVRINKIEKDVSSFLQQYDWPGNVAELKEVVIQAAVASRNQTLERDILASIMHNRLIDVGNKFKVVTLSEIERKQIKAVLVETKNDLRKTSEILGIPESVLERKIGKYNL